jgi:hypothetical protein
MNRLNSENINGLITIDADTINATSISDTNQTSTNIYGQNLYINNQLINFGSYVTSSYFTSQLNNYVLSSYLSSQLSNYATISYVNSQLSNYATNGALSSYRLISDSYAKWEVDNMVAGLSAGIAANGVATTGVIASLAVTNATVAGLVANVSTLNADVATIQGELTTIDGQISTLQGKTQNQTATVGNTNFTGTLQMTNGVNNNITLNQTGDITCLTETLNTLTCNTEIKGNGKLNLTNATQDHELKGNSLTLSQSGKNTSIYGNSYIGAVGSIVQLYGDTVNINNSNSISNLTTTTIGGLFQTIYLNGAVYINGKLVTGFGIGPTNGQWSFPNV